MSDKHGYDGTSVYQLRQLARGPLYQFTEAEISDEDGKLLTKSALIDKIVAFNESSTTDDAPTEMPDSEDVDLFEDAEEEQSPDRIGPEPDEDAEEEPEVVIYGEEGWSDWVIRQFADEELDNGNPVCDALRRMVQKLIGPIINRTLVHVTPGTVENKGMATIGRRVEVNVTNPAHPAFGLTIAEEEIADCGRINTDFPFVNHPSATASTRAEARAYRKLLGLNRVIAAEEAAEAAEQDHGDEWEPDKPISEQQVNVIDLLCKRLDLDVLTYINAGSSGRNYRYVEQVPASAANVMIQYLNRVQQGSKSKPPGVGKYDQRWRDENATRLEQKVSEK